ncbi:hypothetical protein HDU76_008461, partial [Blyttiomyces sp. JEL0837]
MLYGTPPPLGPYIQSMHDDGKEKSKMSKDLSSLEKLEYLISNPIYPVMMNLPLQEFGNEIVSDQVEQPSSTIHNGYILQHGPTILKNTLSRPETETVIVFDQTLRFYFDKLDKHLNEDIDKSVPYCPTLPECRFYFNNEYETMATEADALVTDKIDSGILVHNASLHFTKVGVISNPSKPLESYSWIGTDTAATWKDFDDSNSKPSHLPLSDINTNTRDLFKSLDIDKKIPIVLFVVPEGVCGVTKDRRDNIAETIRDLVSKLPFPILFLVPDNGNALEQWNDDDSVTSGEGEADRARGRINLGLGNFGSCDFLDDIIRDTNLHSYLTVAADILNATDGVYLIQELSNANKDIHKACPPPELPISKLKPPTTSSPNKLTIKQLYARDNHFDCFLENSLISIIIEPYLSPYLITNWVWRSHKSGTWTIYLGSESNQIFLPKPKQTVNLITESLDTQTTRQMAVDLVLKNVTAIAKEGHEFVKKKMKEHRDEAWLGDPLHEYIERGSRYTFPCR